MNGVRRLEIGDQGRRSEIRDAVFCFSPAPAPRSRIPKKRSRPLSRVLSWAAIPLDPASPQDSSNQPGSDAGRAMAPLFGLAPGGVCRAMRRWPRMRCALTTPFHPCHAHPAMPFGGLFSVALSVGSRRPGVTWHLALRSPDFPRRVETRRDCLADSSAKSSGFGPAAVDARIRIAHDSALPRIS